MYAIHTLCKLSACHCVWMLIKRGVVPRCDILYAVYCSAMLAQDNKFDALCSCASDLPHKPSVIRAEVLYKLPEIALAVYHKIGFAVDLIITDIQFFMLVRYTDVIKICYQLFDGVWMLACVNDNRHIRREYRRPV
mgnify:CR=1 FL=1